jgi:hypothetical protein
MKKNLAKIAFLIKKLGFFYRLIGIFIAGYLVFGMAIPDIKFNLTSGKVIEMTLEQLMKTPVDNIPRYLKIKDAVVPSDSYVEFRKKKRNTLTGIYYPVYPSSDLEIDMNNFSDTNDILSNDSIRIFEDTLGNISLLKNPDNLFSRLVIHDTHVKDSDLDSTGTYFSNPKFTIEGQYNGDVLTEDVLRIFKESGLNVSSDALVLNRGNTGMDNGKASILVVFGLLIMLLGVISFIPETTLNTWL